MTAASVLAPNRLSPATVVALLVRAIMLPASTGYPAFRASKSVLWAVPPSDVDRVVASLRKLHAALPRGSAQRARVRIALKKLADIAYRQDVRDLAAVMHAEDHGRPQTCEQCAWGAEIAAARGAS